MYCDNCGGQVDNDALFCSKCGQQLLPQKAPLTPKPSRPSPRYRRKTTDDNLCFGQEQEESGWVGGLVLISIGVFLVAIFYFPEFPIEILIPLGFFLFGAIAIINHARRDRRIE
ncbi:MAG: hypothetical protein ACW964_03725 [Candidatus Hodarchaeales archaeon]|jgi:uncharacterized membrane protein YvbJ